MAVGGRKVVSLLFLVTSILVGFIFREVFALIWAALHVATPAGWILHPTDFLGGAVGFIVFVSLMRSVRAGTFLTEVLMELGRVVWPKRKETVLSTGVVSILVGICAVIMFVFDMMWGTLVSVFYGQ